MFIFLCFTSFRHIMNSISCLVSALIPDKFNIKYDKILTRVDHLLRCLYPGFVLSSQLTPQDLSCFSGCFYQLPYSLLWVPIGLQDPEVLGAVLDVCDVPSWWADFLSPDDTPVHSNHFTKLVEGHSDVAVVHLGFWWLPVSQSVSHLCKTGAGMHLGFSQLRRSTTNTWLM